MPSIERQEKAKKSTLLGRQAENLAKNYLLQQGLCFVESNFHSRAGEIDIVMREASTWVFVEVKYRQDDTHGKAVEFFHAAKRKKFLKAVQYFMHNHSLNPAMVDHRIDLVAIDGAIQDENIQWFKSV